MAGKFAVLLVIDTTRLCRSGELQPLVERLRYQGIRVVGVQDQFDSSTGLSDLQASMSGAMSIEFRRMVKARTHAALETRAKERRPTGGKCYGYDSKGVVIEAQAVIVREIFERHANGASCITIAEELNNRGVPSPGSTWKRETRRWGGWLESAVRVIVLNERYRGVVHWNVCEWRKDPDTGKRTRVERPRSERITHRDQKMRIVSEELWQHVAQRREHRERAIGERVKRGIERSSSRHTGGAPHYLFSTLLQCGQCGANYVMVDKNFYACSSCKHGGAAVCSNSVRVRRTVIEAGLLRGMRTDLLAPEVIEEAERRFAKGMAAEERKASADSSRRITELERLVEHLADAIAGGALKSSAVLARRLADAEQELERLRSQPVAPKVATPVPRIGERYRKLVADLPICRTPCART